MTFPYVADAVQRGTLVLHGAWFDVATGQVLVRTPVGYVEAADLASGPSARGVVNL
jgi:carbonic anhydrase